MVHCDSHKDISFITSLYPIITTSAISQLAYRIFTSLCSKHSRTKDIFHWLSVNWSKSKNQQSKGWWIEVRNACLQIPQFCKMATCFHGWLHLSIDNQCHWTLTCYLHILIWRATSWTRCFARLNFRHCVVSGLPSPRTMVGRVSGKTCWWVDVNS